MRVFYVILALFSNFRFKRVKMGGKWVEKLWVENLNYGWKKQKTPTNLSEFLLSYSSWIWISAFEI